MTESIFPRGDTTCLEIFAKGEAVTLTQLNVYPLERICALANVAPYFNSGASAVVIA